MTLEDLLDYTRRYVLRDFNKPYLWPDELVVSYLSEGTRKLATAVNALIGESWEIPLSQGEDTYPLPDDVVNVYSVRLDGIPGRLVVSTENWTPDSTTEGRPQRYTLDRETQTIRFYLTPDKDYTAIIRGARLPAALSVNDLGADLELKSQYELLPAEWAAYRCFGNDDADGRNDGAADRAKARFDQGLSAYKHDEYRLRTGNNARVQGKRVK